MIVDERRGGSERTGDGLERARRIGRGWHAMIGEVRICERDNR